MEKTPESSREGETDRHARGLRGPGSRVAIGGHGERADLAFPEPRVVRLLLGRRGRGEPARSPARRGRRGPHGHGAIGLPEGLAARTPGSRPRHAELSGHGLRGLADRRPARARRRGRADAPLWPARLGRARAPWPARGLSHLEGSPRLAARALSLAASAGASLPLPEHGGDLV